MSLPTSFSHIKLDTLFQIAFSEATYKKLYIMHVSPAAGFPVTPTKVRIVYFQEQS